MKVKRVFPRHAAKKERRLFLSHNKANKEFVTRVAAVLAALNVHVWLDDWVIRPGDSIPAAIDQGLEEFDTFTLFWSVDAANSKWIDAERDAALTKLMNSSECRFVPVVLDDSPLPLLIAPLKYINGRDEDHIRVARELAGIRDDREYRLAIQEFLENAGLEPREFYGAGVYICCPNCGAPTEQLETWSQMDDLRGDEYAGVRCKVCGWNEGGEV